MNLFEIRQLSSLGLQKIAQKCVDLTPEEKRSLLDSLATYFDLLATGVRSLRESYNEVDHSNPDNTSSEH